MEHSPHAALAADGALQFATSCGLKPERRNTDVLTAHASKRYREYMQGGTAATALPVSNGPTTGIELTHTDTVGIICRQREGSFAVGCASSGMQFKHVGRVGDSPIIGSGLYADKEAGAAVASGDGDQMIRFCLSFLVVEHMRLGKSAQDACREAVMRVRKHDPGCQAAIVAMDTLGNIGASCTHTGFFIVHCFDDAPPRTIAVEGVENMSWEHSCI